MCVQLMLATGRNLDIVTQAQIVEPYKLLHDELPRLSYAYYVAELLDKLTVDEQENRPAYDLLIATLAALDTSAIPDLVVRYYELHLLGFLGYRPYLFQCARSEEHTPELQSRQYLVCRLLLEKKNLATPLSSMC